MTSRKLEETRAWMTPQLKRGAIEVAIVGDLDLEAAIQAVAKTLGALPAREPRPDFTAERAVSMPAKPLTGSYVVDTKIPKAVLEVDWPTTDAMEAKVSRRLNMLAEVLNDRLRVKVREQLGNAYSPQAGSRPSQTYTGYGFISARITVDPAQAQKVKEVVLGLADDMATKGISDDELLRAKNPTLTSIRESLRTNGYWLNTVLARAQEKPVMLDWARTRSQDVEAITVADLNALAKQYLPQSRASTFIVSPK
jgi:zinc protease